MSKLHIKKGDMVYINTGKDRGKTGKVLSVIIDKQRAIVEGCNMMKKSVKPNAKNPQGGFVTTEAPIHISNLNPMLDGKPVRVGRKMDEKGKLVRIDTKTKKEIK